MCKICRHFFIRNKNPQKLISLAQKILLCTYKLTISAELLFKISKNFENGHKSVCHESTKSSFLTVFEFGKPLRKVQTKAYVLKDIPNS